MRISVLPATRVVSVAMLLLAPLFASAQATDLLQPVPQHNRVAGGANFGPQTQLSGHIPAWVTPGNQVAARAVDLSTTLHLSIVLQRDPTVQAAFEKLLADQQNPGSPLYHHWITPQQVGALYGLTSSDLAAVTGWLTAQGLKVDSIQPSETIVEVSGTAATVASAFRTSFAYYTLGATPRLSATSEPFIPTALTPVIASIHGLTDVPLHPMSHIAPGPAPVKSPDGSVQPLLTTTNGSHYLTPNDFAAIYDINSVYSGGNRGASIGGSVQHIAIIGRSRVSSTDISEYAANVGINSYNLNTIIPTTGSDPGPVCTFSNASTCSTSGDQGEQTLDVDRVIGTASGVQADLVVSASSNTQDGVYIAAAYNINMLRDPIMTISYGSCETSSGASGDNVWTSLFSTGAAEGISIFVSSGDSGANACAADFTPTSTTRTASINSICANQYNTCVGGTEFNEGTGTYWSSNNGTGLESALSYIPEGGWNESNGGTSYYPAASGGGPSSYITKPSWQTGTGVPADGARDTPDIALSASGHDSYYICLDYALGQYTSQGITSSDNCTSSGGGYFFGSYGTSAAAPGMAGITALLNTKLGTAQGLVNPLLYGLASTAPTSFHDTTIATSGVSGCVVTTPSMCNNSTPGSSANSTTVAGGVAGYLLQTGYDEVTGLGSVDVANLLANAISAASTTFTVVPTTTAYADTSISATPTVHSDSLTLTSTNFAGSVALTCTVVSTGTATGTCSVSPTPVALASNGTGTSTLTINDTSPVGAAGTLSVTVTGTSGTTVVTSSAVTVTVTAPIITFGVAPTTAAYADVSSSTTGTVHTDSLNLVSTNFTGSVALTCLVTSTGTATGTCSVSPTPVALASNGTGTSTLTINDTSPVGAAGTLSVTVTGTSGTKVITSSPVTVTVTAPTFTLTPAGNTLTFTSGATTGNTEAIAINSAYNFNISSITCSISSGSAYYPPSCSISPTSLNLAAGVPGSATVTISSTTAVSSGLVGPVQHAGFDSRAWPVALTAGVLSLLALGSLRRRRAVRALVALALLAVGLASLSGCGGNGGGNSTPTPVIHSSSGSYIVTVNATGTATGGSTAVPVSTTFALQIN